MKKKLITILLIISIILVGSIGIITYEYGLPPDDQLESIPVSNKEIARIGEIINFSSDNSKGEIKTYLWDFKDGNTSSKRNPSYEYERPGWYNVTLFLENDRGKKDNSTIIIGIQYNDVFEAIEVDREYSLLREWGQGFGVSVDIGYNIGKPIGNIHGVIYNAIGSFSLQIFVMFPNPEGTGGYGETIYSDSKRGIRNDIEFDYIVQPNEIPDEVFNNIAKLQTHVVVDDGTWESAEVSMELIYPMEKTSPFYT